MLLTTAPSLPFSKPIQPDWTIEALLTWIASEDERCHDDGLRPMLRALTRSGEDAASVTSAAPAPATVALVRDLAARVAAQPSLRALTIEEMLAGTAAARGVAR